MSFTTLTGLSPAATSDFLLHSGGVSLATGFFVRMGNGDATKIWMDSNNLGWGGMICSPSRTQRLTATISAPTNTNVALTPFDFTPESGVTYAIEMILIATADALTTGVQIVNTGGAGTLYLYEPGTALGINGASGSYAPTSSPVAVGTGPFVITLKGVFTASSTTALQFALKSELAAHQVQLLAGSSIRITRIP